MEIPQNPYIISLKLHFLACLKQSVHCIITNNLVKTLIANERIPTNQEITIKNINCYLKEINAQFFSGKTYEKLYSTDFSQQILPNMMSDDKVGKDEDYLEDEFVWMTDSCLRIKKTDIIQGLTILFDFKFINQKKRPDVSRNDASLGDILRVVKKNLNSLQQELCIEYVKEQRKKKEAILAQASKKLKQNSKYQKIRNKYFLPTTNINSRLTSSNQLRSATNATSIRHLQSRKKFHINKCKTRKWKNFGEEMLTPVLGSRFKPNNQRKAMMCSFSQIQQVFSFDSEVSFIFNHQKEEKKRGGKMMSIGDRRLMTIQSSAEDRHIQESEITQRQQVYEEHQTLEPQTIIFNNYLQNSLQRSQRISQQQLRKIYKTNPKQFLSKTCRGSEPKERIRIKKDKENRLTYVNLKIMKLEEQGKWSDLKTHRINILRI